MKRILFALASICSLAFAQTGLHVEAFDEQLYNSTQATIRLRVVNSTNETYNNVSLKYYMPYDASRTLQVNPYYVPQATLSQNVVGDQVEISIDIPTLSPGIFPSESGLTFGINYSDWHSFDKTASLSYPNSSSFVTDDNIAIYINGEPYHFVGPLPTDPAAPRFVGVQPQVSQFRSAWVEISNFDVEHSALQGFTVVDAEGHSTQLSGELIKGKKLIICNTTADHCPTADVTIIDEDLAFGLEGELTLYDANNNPVDYIAWGKKGPHAVAVAAANSALNTNEYLRTYYSDFTFGERVYEIGDFYRAVVSETNNTVKEWKLFSASEIEKDVTWLPDPQPLSLSDGSIITLFEGEYMVFSWVAIKNAKKYILTVINDETNEIAAQVETAKTSVSVFLPSGTYRWTVEASQTGDFHTTLEALLEHKDELTKLTILTSVYSNEHIVYDLHVDPLAARKDSYLLDLQWGYRFNEVKGGTPHNLSAYYNDYHQIKFADEFEAEYNEEESWRCWIVGATMLNHYYGGDITQDEIKMYVKGDPDNLILHAFPHDYGGSGSVYDINTALQYALNVGQNDLHYESVRPDENELNDALSQGKPIYIWQRSHIMIIDAMRLNPNIGLTEYRFINTDNNGTYEWRVFEKETQVYGAWIPSNVTAPKAGDPSITTDSDEDGLYDFDETNRFHTKVNKPDSDGDDVNDREEIVSYTLLQTTFDYEWNYAQYYQYPVVNFETYADVDGDGLRAELDYDSDNGGTKDGDEDLNRNGILDEGETNPYDASDDEVITPQPVGEFPALYAISTLRYKNNINCTKVNGDYCDLASAGIQSNVYNPLSIGDDNHVGSVYSLASIMFRSRVTIHGNVELYENANISPLSAYSYYVLGTVNNHTLAEWNNTFPTVIDLPPFQNSKDSTVPAGETFTFEDGDEYGRLIVEPGATIRIPAGEFRVNDLNIKPGANIEFVEPGNRSALHINGEFFWRGNMNYSDAQLKTIASGFEVLIHTYNRDYFVDFPLAARLVAPYSTINLGQTQYIFYGSVIASKINVFDFAIIKNVQYGFNN